MARILIVEDQADLAAGLRDNLALEGHQAWVCDDGKAALAEIQSGQPDLVILDVMLPNRDGFSILQALRRESCPVPVLMLTARGEETDKVRGLRQGADDYVTKPFGLMELLARVEALLRRTGAGEEPATGRHTVFADVELERASRRVWKAGVAVALTPKEFNLLVQLVDHAGQVISRRRLLKEVWGHRYDIASRTVDTHMAELRRKLECDPARPKYLLTARGAGYWLKV